MQQYFVMTNYGEGVEVIFGYGNFSVPEVIENQEIFVNKEKFKKQQECDEFTMKLFDAHLEKENLLNELLQMNKKNMKISSANLSESLMVKFDHLENKSSTNNNDKLLEENINLAKSCEELKQENTKLRQMVKFEREINSNSKKSIDKYEKEKAQFSTWLFTIARNILLQDIKSSKKTISIDTEYDEEGTTLKDFIQEESSDTHIQDVNQRKAEIMKDHISKLKDPYKKVIEMREIKKMAYKDIADELGKNLSTIKSQIRNGRLILTSDTWDLLNKISETSLQYFAP
jgi:RNA polymerase sigma factor (sigma-70 family)